MLCTFTIFGTALTWISKKNGLPPHNSCFLIWHAPATVKTYQCQVYSCERFAIHFSHFVSYQVRGSGVGARLPAPHGIVNRCFTGFSVFVDFRWKSVRRGKPRSTAVANHRNKVPRTHMLWLQLRWHAFTFFLICLAGNRILKNAKVDCLLHN